MAVDTAATSLGLTSSQINIADAGKSPQDGFSEYMPAAKGAPPRPRWETCGGTRDGLANWGTSVNYVVP